MIFLLNNTIFYDSSCLSTYPCFTKLHIFFHITYWWHTSNVYVKNRCHAPFSNCVWLKYKTITCFWRVNVKLHQCSKFANELPTILKMTHRQIEIVDTKIPVNIIMIVYRRITKSIFQLRLYPLKWYCTNYSSSNFIIIIFYRAIWESLHLQYIR